MESGILFTTLVLSIGALHLVWQAAAFVNSHFNKAEKKRVKRDDWYVFFHCSDLTGSKDDGREERPAAQQRPKVSDGRRPTARMHIS